VLAATVVVDETAAVGVVVAFAVVVAAELLLPLQAANVKMAATIGHAVLDAVLMPAPPISQGIAGSNKLRGDRSRWKSCKQNLLLTSMAARLVSVRNTLPVSATARGQRLVKGLRARGKGSHLPTEPPPRKAKQHLRNFFYEPAADSKNCPSLLSLQRYGRDMSISEIRVPPKQTDPLHLVENAIGEGQQVALTTPAGNAVLAPEVVAAIADVLRAFSTGAAVHVTAVPDMLSTSQAAEILGVSRPTVVALIDNGHLPAIRLGSHRRLKLADVLTYKTLAKTKQSAALDELVALSEDLGLYD
jgi:excisionase family DNA binding protein